LLAILIIPVTYYAVETLKDRFTSKKNES